LVEIASVSKLDDGESKPVENGVNKSNNELEKDDNKKEKTVDKVKKKDEDKAKD
jgi:hypothetical protein